MYNRDHGKTFVKDLSKGARQIYKRAFSKIRRKADKRRMRED